MTCSRCIDFSVIDLNCLTNSFVFSPMILELLGKMDNQLNKTLKIRLS